MSCQTIYVMLSSFLSEEEKRIVAAHELGHVILHRTQLNMAPMSDNRLYNMINETEYCLLYNKIPQSCRGDSSKLQREFPQ